MAAKQYKDFRPGVTAELLTEFILSSIAFTTRVSRQDDVGHDFLCALIESEGKLLKAGPSFTVQTKKKGPRKIRISYKGEHETKWIRRQENPFFICIADLDSLNVEIYSTWNRILGFTNNTKAQKITLVPGGRNDNYQEVKTSNDGLEQEIPLGKPILQIASQDVVNEGQAQNFADVLKDWIFIDRQNIVNWSVGIYWYLMCNTFK